MGGVAAAEERRDNHLTLEADIEGARAVGRGGYLGGSTVIGPRSGWFSGVDSWRGDRKAVKKGGSRPNRKTVTKEPPAEPKTLNFDSLRKAFLHGVLDATLRGQALPNIPKKARPRLEVEVAHAGGAAAWARRQPDFEVYLKRKRKKLSLFETDAVQTEEQPTAAAQPESARAKLVYPADDPERRAKIDQLKAERQKLEAMLKDARQVQLRCKAEIKRLNREISASNIGGNETTLPGREPPASPKPLPDSEGHKSNDCERRCFLTQSYIFTSRQAAKDFARLCTNIAIRHMVEIGLIRDEATRATIRGTFQPAIHTGHEPASCQTNTAGTEFAGWGSTQAIIAHEVAHWADQWAHRLRGVDGHREAHGTRWRGWYTYILSQAAPDTYSEAEMARCWSLDGLTIELPIEQALLGATPQPTLKTQSVETSPSPASSR